MGGQWRVVIADDEEKVCKLIQYSADWNSLNMTVVGTACNSLEAYEMTASLKADILITDIRMPGCDGLELIRRVKALAAGTQMIIISGYSDFPYAQEAIRCGVCDYLLKPVNRQQLAEALKKAAAILATNARAYGEDESREKALRFQRNSIRERVFLHMIAAAEFSSTPTDSSMEALPEGEFLHPCFRLLILEFQRDMSDEAFRQLVKKCLLNWLEHCFSGAELDVIAADQGACCYFLLNYNEEISHKIDGRLPHIFEAFNDREASAFFGEHSRSTGSASPSGRPYPGNIPELIMAAGIEVRGREALLSGIADAQSALWNKLIPEMPRRQLLENNLPDKSENLRRQLQLDWLQACQLAASTLTVDPLAVALEIMNSRLAEYLPYSGRTLLNLMLALDQILLLSLLREGYPVNLEAEVASHRQKLCQSRSADELTGAFKSVVTEMIGRFDRLQISKLSRPVRLGKKYIERHFRETIVLEEVSEVAGLSPTYFSSVFKKETGENFLDYLTYLRMEEAKILLKRTNDTIQAISGAVGYRDLKHFYRNFKKMTGLKPGEYRRLYAYPADS